MVAFEAGPFKLAWWLTDVHGPRLTNSPQMRAAAEWAAREAELRGLPLMVQRVKALDAFVSDVYGDRVVVSDGVIPNWVIDGSPERRYAFARAWSRGSRLRTRRRTHDSREGGKRRRRRVHFR